MFKQLNTRQLRWAVTASVALLFLGAVTFINAQENKSARSADEIQAQIDRLNAELQQIKEEQTKEKTATAVTRADETLTGNYLGMEGNDWIGIVIGKPQDNTLPITIYEDGLPEHGFDPKDDDKYIGTATIKNVSKEKSMLTITLKQKFDELREEPVEPVLCELIATVEFTADQKEFVLTIPRNQKWDAVRAIKYVPQPRNSNPAVPGQGLAGRYLGYEGDDRMGMVLTPANGEGTFDIVFYEDGLPGAGYNRRNDDRYEGTATFRGEVLDIRLTKKFDDDREEQVEGALKQLSATVYNEGGGVKLTIQRNPEWDAVGLKKL